MSKIIEEYDFFAEYRGIVNFILNHPDYDPDDQDEWLDFFQEMLTQNLEKNFKYRIHLGPSEIGCKKARYIIRHTKRFMSKHEEWLDENVNGSMLYFVHAEYEKFASMLFTSQEDAVAFKMIL